MANRVSQEDIKIFNELYFECHNYVQVARDTGFSPSTVKKYVIDGWKPIAQDAVVRFKEPLPEFDSSIFRLREWGSLCQLGESERKEIEGLKKEVSI